MTTDLTTADAALKHAASRLDLQREMDSPGFVQGACRSPTTPSSHFPFSPATPLNPLP